MEEDWFNFSESLGYLTLVTSRLFTGVLGRKLTEANLDLTAEQWAVLRILLNEDGLSQEALLGFTRYEKSTLSRVLDGMEKKVLIERRKSEDDARRKKVYIMPKGLAEGEVGTNIALENLRVLYRGIPQEDLNTCRAVIELLQARLQRMLRGEDV